MEIRGITITQLSNGDILYTIFPDQLTTSLAQFTKPCRAVSKKRYKPANKGGYTHFSPEIKEPKKVAEIAEN